MVTTYNRSVSRFKPELLPPPSAFYRKELPGLSRPSRGWARTACPFHKGTNKTAFSVNLQTGAFHCFNCQAAGSDVLAFIMLRENLDFKRACLSLGAWDESEMTWQDRRKLRRERERRESQRLIEIDRAELERRRRIEARDWLLAWRGAYRVADRRLREIGKGAAEKFAGEREACWGIMADVLPWIREADARYCQLAGIECPA